MSMNSLISKVIFRLRKRPVVLNALQFDEKQSQSNRRVLLYYKTDPLFSKRLQNSYQHTNNRELIEMIRVLHQLGFSVDVIDRSASWDDVKPLLKNNYVMYIANAAGNSAPLHVDIVKNINAKCKIYYAAGPEPGYSNELVHQRHSEFDKRTGSKCVKRRILNEANFDERLEGMDAIFYIGNDFAASTFQRISSLPMYQMISSTSPTLSLSLDDIENKSAKSFLYFGGNGLICKGLDLVLEAFDGLSHLSLDVCGPENETDFWQYYKPLLERNPQIKYHGFVDVNGKLFKKITSRTTYNIFPSCSEGGAGSVITAMRRGVIPVVTPESGVDIEKFGCMIENATVDGIRVIIKELSIMPMEDIKRRVLKTYLSSNRYSIDGFKSNLTQAIASVLSLKKII